MKLLWRGIGVRGVTRNLANIKNKTVLNLIIQREAQLDVRNLGAAEKFLVEHDSAICSPNET
jgi:hypothetical protein